MVILVLDDGLSNRAEPGILMAGKNRSEELFMELTESGFEALLYDGRANDGVTELANPIDAADELVRRVCELYSVLPVKCGIILDLDWFNNKEYGETLLDQLLTKTQLSVDKKKIIVLSVITDSSLRKRFILKFGLSADQVWDRGQLASERIISFFKQP